VNSQTIVSACPGHFAAKVQGETVILHGKSGRYFGINEVGTEVWEKIQQPVAISDIVDSLLPVYNVDHQTLQADVIQLLQAFVDQQLAQECPNPQDLG
jgi:hypothetical protein